MQTSFLHKETGAAEVWGRIGDAGAGAAGLGIPVYPDGYFLAVEQNGTWQLGVSVGGDRRALARGTVKLKPHQWHSAALRFEGASITAVIDGVDTRTVDDGTFAAGYAGIGTGWNRVQFDDLAITAA